MDTNTLKDAISIYYDLVHDFDLQDRVYFTYTDKHSKISGIHVNYEKVPGVCYIPFIKRGYPITLNLIDNV